MVGGDAGSISGKQAAPGSRCSLGAPDVNASDTHNGGALQQWRCPLGFFSRKLSAVEVKYATFDRELLAAHDTIRHFRELLEARPFQLWTDHKPLVAAFQSAATPTPPRRQRQMAFISEYTTDIRHTPGSDNVVADCLSRPPPPQSPQAGKVQVLAAVAAPAAPAVDLRDMALRQILCQETQQLRGHPNLTVVGRPLGDLTLYGDTSTGTFRPLVPQELRRPVFDAVHGLAHAGTRATRRLLTAAYMWPRMKADCARWVRDCLPCQRSKVHRHIHVRPAHIAVPERRFAHIHVDLVGPLPQSGGHRYLFTIIDRTTRWVEAVPLASTSAADCADALVAGWVARFGVPADLTSDRGAQFTSAIWGELCNRLGIHHITTTAYHPEGNGMVERIHRRLKDALRARCSGQDWLSHLPWVLLGVRAAPREDTAVSPAQAVLGTTLVLPADAGAAAEPLAAPERPLDDFLQTFRETLGAAEYTNSRHNTAANHLSPPTVPAALSAAPAVLVRRDGHVAPLRPSTTGRTACCGGSSFTIPYRWGTEKRLCTCRA